MDRTAWDSLIQGSGDPVARPRVTVTGPSSLLPSRLRVMDAAVTCVGTALAAASALHRARTGTDWSAQLDRGQIAAAMTSERRFKVQGRPAVLGFAALSRFWPASDGWVRTHANFPWHLRALLRALEVPEASEAAVGEAIGSLPAERVETAVSDAGGVAAAVRSVDQWRAHPQGRAVASEPLVGLSVVPSAPARIRPGGVLPASGIRVLDFTRVIAGPVCTRYLGALGADVLRIDSPEVPDLEPGDYADTLLAKRSASLDLASQPARVTLQSLLEAADVVVCGYRPGALARFGLGIEDLVDRHPGLVVVVLDAWGHDGPWADRRGFDSVVQAPTGIALRESEGGVVPGALPCQFLDHGTGYLAAAAALDGLRRQMVDGGSYVRRLSLARTAHFLVEAGDQQSGDGQESADASDDQWLVDLGLDGVWAIGPPGGLGGEALRWQGPPARYLDDPPEWPPTAGDVQAMELRRVRLSDAAVAPLLDGLAQEYDTRYGETLEMTRASEDEFDPPSGLFLVVVDGPNTVAGGGFRRHDAATCEVKRMWTHPDYRRRGMAARVLQALEDAAREAGYTRLVLETGPRQPEAEAFYAKRGYDRIAYFGHYPEARAFSRDLYRR